MGDGALEEADDGEEADEVINPLTFLEAAFAQDSCWLALAIRLCSHAKAVLCSAAMRTGCKATPCALLVTWPIVRRPAREIHPSGGITQGHWGESEGERVGCNVDAT